MFKFQDLTTLESQMESLKTKGFLRAYKPYSPPSDLLPRFLATCSTALGTPIVEEMLETITMDDLSTKSKVLSALHSEFGHLVHNSRLHEMKNLDRVLFFYKSEVCALNPYEQLHRDKEADLLPDNLVVQLDSIRFTGEGDHPLDKVISWFLLETSNWPCFPGICLPAFRHHSDWSEEQREVCFFECQAQHVGGVRLQIASSAPSVLSSFCTCRVWHILSYSQGCLGCPPESRSPNPVVSGAQFRSP